MDLRRLANFLETLPTPVRRFFGLLIRKLGGMIYRCGSILGRVATGGGRIVKHLNEIQSGAQSIGERLQARSQRLFGSVQDIQCHYSKEGIVANSASVKYLDGNYNYLAQRYLSAARTIDGMQALEIHLQKHCHDAHAYISLFRLYLNLGKPAQALEVLHRALKTDSDRLTLQAVLGDFLYRTYRLGLLMKNYGKQFEGEFYKDELFTGPLDPDTALENSLLSLNSALEQPVSGGRRNERALVALRLALLHFSEGDYDKVQIHCKMAKDMNVNLPWANYLLGIVAEEENQSKQAIQAFSAAVKSHPVFAAAHAKLGYLHSTEDVMRAARHFNARLEGGSISVETV